MAPFPQLNSTNHREAGPGAQLGKMRGDPAGSSGPEINMLVRKPGLWWAARINATLGVPVQRLWHSPQSRGAPVHPNHSHARHPEFPRDQQGATCRELAEDLVNREDGGEEVGFGQEEQPV